MQRRARPARCARPRTGSAAREEAEAIGLSNPRLTTFATEYILAHKK